MFYEFLRIFVISYPFFHEPLTPWPHYNLCEDLLILGAVLSTCGDLCWGVSIWCQWFFHLSSDILSWDHVKDSESAFILVIHMWAICFPYTSFLSHITWVYLFELARKSERRKSEYPCEILYFPFVRSMHRYSPLLG